MSNVGRRDDMLALAVVTSVLFIAGALHSLTEDVNDKKDMNDTYNTERQQRHNKQANSVNDSQR